VPSSGTFAVVTIDDDRQLGHDPGAGRGGDDTEALDGLVSERAFLTSPPQICFGEG